MNLPPYNFVFLDTCNSGFQADLASGFGITTLTASNDDRAFLGWQTLVEDSLKNADWANYVYQDLQNGQTIDYAVNDANTHYPSMKQSSDATDPGYYLSAQPTQFGDGAMTLHGTVHGGALHQWFN